MTARAIGRYEIIGLLGSGGIGHVYAARDPQLGRAVAIKSLRPEYSADRGFLDRFRAEAANLAGLSHPNITTLYDLHSDGQQLYMVMELVHGHTLETVLTRCKRLGLRESLAIIAQTASGLGHAHRVDVIHRDIKPSNLMLTESGLLKITDFGIARVRGSQRLTRAGSIVGTLAYVPPEQIKGLEGDERSDLYSLACVLYEMLSGDPPFNADTEYELIRAHVEAHPAPLANRIPGLPASVEQALLCALAKNPDERFATIEEFSRALGADVIQGQAAEIVRASVLPLAGVLTTQRPKIDFRSAPPRSGAPPPRQTVQPGTAPKARSNRRPAIVLSTVVASLLGGLGFMLWRPDEANPPPRQVVAVEPAPLAPAVERAPVVPPPSPAPAVLQVPTQTAAIPELHPAIQTVPPSSMILGNPEPKPLPAIEKPAVVALQVPPPPPVVKTPPPEIQAALAPLNPVAPSAEKPAYQGRVANWMVADTLFVPQAGKFGFQQLRLFGITDTTASQAQAEGHRQQLNAYLASVGNTVTCFAKAANAFQCFAETQDIALWAVRHGLARVTHDAPQEYREAAQ
ncbi:MAG: serine/threonine protein kinase [Acetobacteraceae bacterium]|nr:serine/threonine protein kinase [Acetobacteraceae bacterium]